MHLVAAGLTFRSAPLAVRDRVAVDDEGTERLLGYLTGHCGLSGAVVLSTCNRTEFYVSAGTAALAADVVPRLARYLDAGAESELAGCIVAHHGSGAVHHIFRVAGGLESMVVGEAQVLGQLRSAYRRATESGTLDADLDFILRGAMTAGKRVRSETALGRRAVSLGEVAVDVARQRVGDLRGRGVLLVGAGKMSVRAGRRLAACGAELLVCSRGPSMAALAAQLGGRSVALDDVAAAAADFDVVISSTAAPSWVVDRHRAEFWQEVRGHRPLVVIDLAVPRDIEPSVAEVPGVDLIDVDGLAPAARLAGGGDEAIAVARSLVDEAADRAVRELSVRRSTAPTIAALVERAEQLRRREVERTLDRLPGLDPAIKQSIEIMTRSLVRKLLHDPIDHLRSASADGEVARIVRDAFALDRDGDDEGAARSA